MKKLTIKPYQPSDAPVWNDFVARSINGTFLFDRRFMDYHSDRFTDASFMVYAADKLVAVIPGNVVDGNWYSHLGLTYGGIITIKRWRVERLESLMDELVALSRKQDFKSLTFKTQPNIYESQPSDAHPYLLYKKGASIERREINFVIDLTQKIPTHSSKSILQRNGSFENLEMREGDFDGFWNKVLSPQLRARHGVDPVHSLSEIKLLQSRFHENIKQYNAYKDDELLAGITIFLKDNIAKAQYTSTTNKGMELVAQDFLYLSLIDQFKSEGYEWFDLGITTEDAGKQYNKGLTGYKERLGAYPVIQERIKLEL